MTDKKRIYCMTCDFEGIVTWEDIVFGVEFCPSCGEQLEYHEDDEYENTER